MAVPDFGNTVAYEVPQEWLRFQQGTLRGDRQSAYLGEGSVVVNADGSGSVTIAAPARGWEKGPYLVWVEGEYDDHGQRVGAWLFKYTVDGATGGCSAGSKPGSTGTGTTGSGRGRGRDHGRTAAHRCLRSASADRPGPVGPGRSFVALR
ncbi:hypothetical protein CGZ93_06005 [Enemella dayhoffiae]|uniref:Uncharacterized protein n=1 Tax=Enemella dayhoffiae TaxID=2016507 RepID=A0A255H7B1_9ACTN|nr:hypothetical protein [Enemella dayhoffiae]OYO23491.1 hypothetical protein CGZ93_06005 [Enemella dayhoffiae]